MLIWLGIILAVVIAAIIVYFFKSGTKKGPGSWDGTQRNA